VQVAEDFCVGFELRRKELAKFGQGGGRGKGVGVSGFVVDDPPGLISGGLRLRASAEDAVYLHGAQTAGDDPGPANFARAFGVGRKDPLSDGLIGGIEGEAERFCGDGGGFGLIYTCGADLCGNLGLELLECGAGCVPVMRFAELG
jgi:hypothetical protein